MAARVTIILPADPERLQLGGIASFVRGFTKFAPDDLQLRFVGVASGDLPRAVGAWSDVELEGRQLRFLPVSHRSSTARGRVPLALSFTAGLRRFRGEIAAEPSVLQFHRPATAMPLLRQPAPKVRVVHLTTDQLRSAGSESRWRLLGPALNRFEARTFRAMDRIYVVNREAAELYRRRYPRLADRIGFVPNWVDDTIFAPLSDDARNAARARLRSRLGLPPEARIVLFAGRLERQKDPDLLIDTFAVVSQARPTTLLIVGDGGLRSSAEARAGARELGAATRFLDPVARDQLAELMNASDCLVITSAFETGPTVAYEALACGLPIVSTAVGQVPELVRSGVNGEVVADRVARHLGEAIDRVLALPPTETRSAATAAAAPFRASAVLAPLYEEHIRLAG